MKIIPPIILTPKHFEPIEKEIMRFFNEAIYRPLFEAINVEKEFFNANDPLEEAIRNGTVDYEAGTFTGNFSAAISRRLKALGAKFNQLRKSWSIDRSKVPGGVLFAKAHADEAFNAMRKRVLKTLDDTTIDSIFAHNFNWSYTQSKYEEAIEWMNDDFKKSVKNISIAPTLTAAQKKIIAEQWTNNLKLYIRGWTRENTAKLRDQVQKMAFAGLRSSSMIKLIQDNYGVGEAKAKFLARQETSLLLSKFREERYKDVGVTRYKWDTAGDRRVRPDHEHLDGKIFLFSSPPIVDRKTGRRANPGEDFNCRCVARPIWD